MADEKKYYYRMFYMQFRWLHQIINLPKGFQIEHVEYNDPSRLAYPVRIRCPEEAQYEIDQSKEIPEVWDCTLHTNEYGITDKMWWPSLGQEEPADKENQYIHNLEASFKVLMKKYRPNVNAELYIQDIKSNTLYAPDVSEVS